MRKRPQSHQQNREGELHSAFANVEPVRQMDSIDSTSHDDDDTDGSDTLEGAEKDTQSACALSQPNQLAVDHRKMLASRKAPRFRAAESPKQNAAAVIQNRHATRRIRSARFEAEDLRARARFRCSWRARYRMQPSM